MSASPWRTSPSPLGDLKKSSRFMVSIKSEIRTFPGADPSCALSSFFPRRVWSAVPLLPERSLLTIVETSSGVPLTSTEMPSGVVIFASATLLPPLLASKSSISTPSSSRPCPESAARLSYEQVVRAGCLSSFVRNASRVLRVELESPPMTSALERNRHRPNSKCVKRFRSPEHL